MQQYLSGRGFFLVKNLLPCSLFSFLFHFIFCLKYYCSLATLFPLVNYQKALQAELDLVCRTLRTCYSWATPQKGAAYWTHWIGAEHLTSSLFHGFLSIRPASP